MARRKSSGGVVCEEGSDVRDRQPSLRSSSSCSCSSVCSSTVALLPLFILPTMPEEASTRLAERLRLTRACGAGAVEVEAAENFVKREERSLAGEGGGLGRDIAIDLGTLGGTAAVGTAVALAEGAGAGRW